MKVDGSLGQRENFGNLDRRLAASYPGQRLEFTVIELNISCPDIGSCDTCEAGRYDRSKKVEIDRLGDIVVGAKLPSLELAIWIGPGGEKHERHVAEPGRDRGQVLQYLDIAQYQIGHRLENRRKSCATIVRNDDIEFNRSSADVRDIWLPSTRFIGDLNNFTSDFRAAESRHLLSSTSTESVASKKEIADLGQAVVLAQNGYEGLHHSPEIASQYAQFKQRWMEYRKVADKVLQLNAAGRTSEAIDLYRTTSQSTYDAASDPLGRVTRLNIASANAASDQADAAYQSARAFIGIAIMIAAVLVIAARFYVKRFVSTPLFDLASCMHKLTGNDTDIEIRGIQRIDEIGEMARALVGFRTNAIEGSRFTVRLPMWVPPTEILSLSALTGD
jgi:HAMP domain-containing protein